MESSRIKEIIILLVVLALIGGFILFMRNQSLKKELQAEKDKMELAARKEAEAQDRAARRLAEEKEREERKLAEKKEREERKLAEEKKRAEDAELRKYEAGVQGKRKRIAQLRKKLADLGKMSDFPTPEAKRIADEIAELDRMRKDDKYKCFDFCINFRNIEFERTMRRDRDESDMRGYYSVLRKGDRGRHVKVSYHCNEHGITWKRGMADSYRKKYIPLPRLEEKRNRLAAELKRIRRNEQANRANEIAKLKSELAAAEKELAEMEKAQPGSN